MHLQYDKRLRINTSAQMQIEFNIISKNFYISKIEIELHV